MSHASEFDAHGHKDHGHVIVSSVTLRLVLTALLFFTLLTVGAAQFEDWIAHAFNVAIPNWFNVAVCLTIATIKTLLVVTFFMQLKYDNPLNSMILVFSVLTVGFFLGFTMLDLGNRNSLDPMKARYEVDGGTGLTGVLSKGTVVEGQSGPITDAATLAARAKGTYNLHAAHAEEQGVEQIITDAGFVAKLPSTGSSPNISRPVKGITLPGLPGYKPPHEAHGEAAGEHAGDAKPAEGKPAEAKPAEMKPVEAKPEATKPEPTKH